jgi:hypothetical protein
MEQTNFERANTLIDNKNSEDIRLEKFEGQEFPKELLYSKRMSLRLLNFKPDASEELQIAAHAQHICRWKIERNNYSMDKVGYIKWREALKTMHADITTDILKNVGYDSEFIARVSFLIRKKLIKKDKETQTLEDIICLVFLEHYFEVFAAKHPNEKVIEILKKTWSKMSTEGQAEALKLDYSTKSANLIKQAMA